MPKKKPKRPTKRARCYHPQEMLDQYNGLQRDFEEHRAGQRAEVDAARGDAAKFLGEVCRLKPFKYQLEFARLYREHQFLAVRWPRQTGKSTVIGGLMLQDAYENKDLNVAFLGPSWRQTKLNLRRVASF